MACAKCGRECSGTYCETCQFYAYNDQCWRCRMYLPRLELQQWMGQTYCPYCIMDVQQAKAAETREAERVRGGIEKDDKGVPPDEQPPPIGQKNPDYECDKCKHDMDIAYIVADHKFCDICFNEQLSYWKKEGVKVPPYMKFRLKENAGLFRRFIHFLKHKLSEEWKKRTKKKND